MSEISNFFKSVTEKIASITGKDEEEDIEEPSLPDTAKDRFGKVNDIEDAEESKGEENIEGEESESGGAPEQLPNIDFPEEDKQEGEEEKESSSSMNQPPEPKEEHRIIPDNSESVPDIEDEIKEFENAVSEISGGKITPESSSVRKDKVDMEKGFFSEFQRFLEGNEVPKVADELLDKDLMSKMKDYHRHREEGKPYYFHSDELKEELQERMMELRDLEREWFIHKQRLSKEERLLVEKEEELEEKVEEMKYLMKQIKQRDEFTREAPPEDYFVLANGHKLKSLSDLKAALQVMDERIFEHHVSGERNDFAAWVRNVFDKELLADKVLDCTSKEEMVKVLVNEEGN